MNFIAGIFQRDNSFLQEIFLHLCKYSNSEIIVTDEKFNIVFHNSKFITDNKKYSLFDITDNFKNDNIRINIENFKYSANNHLCLKLVCSDNGVLNNMPIDLHICKIKNKKNKLQGYSAIIQDISQEVRNRIQKETFIDIISHDLKNPMRANIQILELIMKNKFGKVEDNLRVVLDELLNSCKFMNYMADNLLIKYKNEFDLYELQKQKYSIVNLIKDRCNNLTHFLDRKKQTIELIVKGNLPDVIIDVDEMSKVVSNLIINASEQSVENSKIKIEVENNKKNVNVSIIDFGYPKKPEILNGIFEEYITCSNKFRKVGFGLELYNCRKIIEAHNGNISARNDSNTGTSITFTLPVAC